jgi:hypothetical protein
MTTAVAPTTVSSIDPRFIIDRQGKPAVLYAGLLDLAHRSGLKSVVTSLLQAPTAENGQTAICHALVETERGIFSGIGDANPANVGRMVALHIIRMAETRAKARALRDALNVGGVSLEELGPEGDDDRPVARADPRPLQVVPATPAANDTLQRTHDNILEWVQAYHAVSGELVAMPDGMNLAQATKYLRDLQTRATEADAALKETRKLLQSGHENLKKLTGEDVPVPEKLTLPDAQALLATLRASYRAALTAQSAGAAR